MSEYTHSGAHQPGLHPDADSLNSFIEGVLPEHERLECLSHLSECARCREIVFVAQEPAEPPVPVAPDPLPMWKRVSRLLAPIPVFSAAAVVGALAILAVVVVQKKPATPQPVLTAIVRPPA